MVKSLMNILKRTINKLLSLIFVPKCVGCGERLSDDELFCKKCFEFFMKARKETCPTCNRRIDRCTCSTKILSDNGVSKYIKLLHYRSGDINPVNNMAYELKERHNGKLNDFLAVQLALPISKCIESGKSKDYIITYVPRSLNAIKRFGYDQAEELSLKIAKILDLEWKKVIKRKGGKAQKNFSLKDRRKNAEKSFCPAFDDYDFKGRKFILIDDIVTSGYTVIACKKILKFFGAKEVIVASVFNSTKN